MTSIVPTDATAQRRPGQPVVLSDLTETERRLCETFPRGDVFDRTGTDPGANDPDQGKGWGAGRTIRAEVVRRLLLGGVPAEPGRIASLRVTGVQVIGVLDLSYAKITSPVSFQHCSFAEVPDLRWAELRGFSVDHSRLPGIRMDNAVIDADFSLAASTIDGRIVASAARVKGSCNLSGARIACSSDSVLDAGRLSVGGNLRMDEGFTSTGELVLVDAHIAGSFSLSGAELRNPGKVAIDGSRLVVDGPVFCRDNFTADGAVVLRRARIGGFLDLGSARLSNPGGDALLAPVLNVGSLSCGDTVFDGGVSLVDARIHGALNLSGARLHNSGKVALDGSRLVVDGPVFCRDNFTADGTVVLRRAKIGGFLDFVCARLSNPGGDALFAPALAVEGGLFCRQTTFHGRVSLAEARIPGSLDLSGADIRSGTPVALDCAHLTAPRLVLPRAAVDGVFDLSHTRLQVLDAQPESSPAGVRAAGLTYETLEPLLDAEQRIRWLDTGTDYTPQPYEQLASAYRRIGHETDARKVLLAKQRRRRRSLPPGAKLWGWIQDFTTGYGYRPGLAAGWLAALLVLGAVVFTVQPPAAKRDAPHFNSFFYALDLLLPILTYGQEASFTPHGGYQWFAFGLVTAGWVLATALIAGITRVLSRS